MAKTAPKQIELMGMPVAVTVLCGLVIWACRYDYTPERLPGISEGAVWSGGPDGGIWLECFLDEQENADWCTAWSDQTGSVVARTYFVYRESGDPASEDELRGAFFDGIDIHLPDGRRLEPLKFHMTEQDELPPAPIDPPRESQ
jgi:hypothetical protein